MIDILRKAFVVASMLFVLIMVMAVLLGEPTVARNALLASMGTIVGAMVCAYHS